VKTLTFTAGPFGQNCYLAICESGNAVAIDPGAAAPRMVASLLEERAELVAILLTHAHLDHVEGVARLLRHRAVPIWLHPADRPLYDAAPAQAAAFGVQIETPPPPDNVFAHGETFRFGDCGLEVRHAPGHSPGHVILYAADAGLAFVGDVIFYRSIGRSDLPGGDFRQLMRSIREQVLSLPEETRLLSGHGPETTVADERLGNPFLIPQFGGQLA
jgi:glyoxylase-like metal-dependent hydrolase (beta-lactamase superfamily II)